MDTTGGKASFSPGSPCLKGEHIRAGTQNTAGEHTGAPLARPNSRRRPPSSHAVPRASTHRATQVASTHAPAHRTPQSRTPQLPSNAAPQAEGPQPRHKRTHTTRAPTRDDGPRHTVTPRHATAHRCTCERGTGRQRQRPANVHGSDVTPGPRTSGTRPARTSSPTTKEAQHARGTHSHARVHTSGSTLPKLRGRIGNIEQQSRAAVEQ